jgi:integrase
VLVDPKTKLSNRPVPLPKMCVDALRAQRERQARERAEAVVGLDEWDLVFTTTVGTPIEPRNVLRQFQTVCARVGLRACGSTSCATPMPRYCWHKASSHG